MTALSWKHICLSENRQMEKTHLVYNSVPRNCLSQRRRGGNGPWWLQALIEVVFTPLWKWFLWVSLASRWARDHQWRGLCWVLPAHWTQTSILDVPGLDFQVHSLVLENTCCQLSEGCGFSPNTCRGTYATWKSDLSGSKFLALFK